jgi:hypothetical protein
MERWDYWATTPGNPELPSRRTPHTHYIGVIGGKVTPIDHGFRVNGWADVMGNGSPAPFGLVSGDHRHH